jgi:diketogulonate reductase-like aldo/keto reductase
MNYKTSNENIKIPTILYGTAWKKEQTAKCVETALLSGFRGVDTAGQPKHYQEHLVGEGLLKAYKNGLNREDIYLQTKFTPIDGQDVTNMPYDKKSSLDEQIMTSFEQSKKNLHTNYIDSYVLHSPIFPGSKLKLAWSTMESFYDKKEIGQLGISNCYDLDVLKYLYENSKVKPALVQNRFYAQTSYDKEIRSWCKEKGIIYQGFWTLTANPDIVASQKIVKIAKRYGKTNEQIFYRYLNHINIIPLIGTTSKNHMLEDVSIFDFELEKNEVESISLLLNI